MRYLIGDKKIGKILVGDNLGRGKTYSLRKLLVTFTRPIIQISYFFPDQNYEISQFSPTIFLNWPFK